MNPSMAVILRLLYDSSQVAPKDENGRKDIRRRDARHFPGQILDSLLEVSTENTVRVSLSNSLNTRE